MDQQVTPAPMSAVKRLISAVFTAASNRIGKAIADRLKANTWHDPVIPAKPDNLDPKRGADESQADYRARRAAINAWSAYTTKPKAAGSFRQHANKARQDKLRNRAMFGGSARQYRNYVKSSGLWLKHGA